MDKIINGVKFIYVKPPAKVERHLAQLVIKNKKPSTNIDISRDPEIYKKAGLDVLPQSNAWWNEVDEPKSWLIAKKMPFEEAWLKLEKPEYPVLKRRLNKLLSELNGKSIAEAQVFLSAYPRVDRKYPMVKKRNLERPEVAIVSGVLFGFEACCIKYYIDSEYFNKPRDPNTIGPFICPECIIGEKYHDYQTLI